MTQPPPPGEPGPNWQQGPHPQQQGYPQQGYPQQGFTQQAPPKKKWGCMKIGLIVLGVLVVLGIIIAAVSSGGDDSPSVTPGENSSQDAAEDGASGVDFQGKTGKDTSANAGDTITKDDVATTTSPLTATTTTFGTPVMCTTVSIQNNGDKPVSFNSIDWKLQDPNGAARMTTFTGSGNELSAGELAPGGQVSGDVCFDGDPAAQPGQYVVLNDGFISFSSDRLAWVNNF